MMKVQTLQAQEKKNRFDSDYYIEGYAAKFEPYVLFERDGVKVYEELDRDALVGADLTDVILQYDHEGRVLARNSNGTLALETDDNGLFVSADLGSTEASRELYDEISKGLITKMSWAFTVADEEYDADTRTRYIKRIDKVYDVSAVSIPANNDTDVQARSFFDGVIEEEQRESLYRERLILELNLKLKLNEGEMSK